MFKAQGVISKLSTLADRTIRVQVDCQEQSPAAEAELFRLRGKAGWFAFNEAEVADIDLPDEPVEFKGQKSLSQRLYNTLYKLHQAQGGKPEDFEDYRHKVMERLLEHYKQKIDEYT